jgi:hypothetical protein
MEWGGERVPRRGFERQRSLKVDGVAMAGGS